jgi:NAD+ diphosphatase
MKLIYCVECAAPLTKQDDHHYICNNGHTYYNNPKATADALFLNNKGKFLASRRAREPFKGTYDLPGGFIEYGESAEAAIIREIKEETQLDITADDLEIIFSAPGTYFENEWLITTVYLIKHWDGEFAASDDSAALEWKPLSFMDSPLFGTCYKGLREVVEQKLT